MLKNRRSGLMARNAGRGGKPGQFLRPKMLQQKMPAEDFLAVQGAICNFTYHGTMFTMSARRRQKLRPAHDVLKEM